MPTNLWRNNLKIIRKQLGKTQSDIGFQMNRTQQTIGNWEKGVSEPNIEEIISLTKILGISAEDFFNVDYEKGNLTEKANSTKKGNLKGNLTSNLKHQISGNTLVEEEASFYVENRDLKLVKSLPKVVSVDTAGEENTVMVPTKARAGYALGYGDPNFIESLPAYKLPGMNNGTYRIFEVDGLSMFPTLQDKDLAIARWTPLSEIRDDRVHVLVTANHGLLIKRTLYRPKDGILVCKSDHNERGLYPNIVLDVQEVKECWYVVERMTKHLPSPGEIYKRITDLEADIAVIKNKMLGS